MLEPAITWKAVAGNNDDIAIRQIDDQACISRNHDENPYSRFEQTA